VSIPFTKAQAVGNDFLVIERSDLDSAGISNSDLPGFAKQICHRYFGVGADGLEVVSATDSADAEIHLWNSDGSSAELSGNGTRCVAAYLTSAKRVIENFSISTDAGDKQLELLSAAHPSYVFKMAMGLPSYQAADIDTKLTIAGNLSTVTLVNVGNPQCALFVDSFDFDWRKLGAAIEQHPHFPGRTNVSFIRVINRHTIDVRFWERGAGETQASGSSSCAAASAAIRLGLVETPVKVKAPGGTLRIDVDDDYNLTMEGPVAEVGRGSLSPSFVRELKGR